MMVSFLLAFLIAMVVLVGMGFDMFLSQQHKGQSDCDETALTIAKSLNDGDRIGQMNAVIERCRELVYVSRESDNAAMSLGISGYVGLAHNLLEESRQSAGLVDTERKNQINLAISELRKFIQAMHEKVKSKGIFLLGWLLDANPEITKAKLGSITGTLSSVESPKALPNLHEFDTKKKYFEPVSNLYSGNLNAKLPPPDDDLTFRFASLPAHVQNFSVPPRLVNPEVFVKSAIVLDKDLTAITKPTDLCSAVQINGITSINTSQGDHWEIEIVSTATASSALEAP